VNWQQRKALLVECVVDSLRQAGLSSTTSTPQAGKRWSQVYESSTSEDSAVLRATISSSPGTLTLSVIVRQQTT
jgi:hypothetical protein